MKKKTYSDGLIEGYRRGHRDTRESYEEAEKRMKRIRKLINKLRSSR